MRPFKKAFGVYDNRVDRNTTWTDGPGTHLFRCYVQLAGQPPLKVQLRAHNWRQAKAFAWRRWGKDAIVKMLGKVR